MIVVDDPNLAPQVDRYLEETGARYVLLDDPGQVAALRSIEGARWRPLHSERDGGREAWIFERVATH
jgi:hypothetical protein